MRKALIPAFLLVVTAIVLGSTLFREQVVNAATTPFQNVVVQNTSTNPVPVQQVGTSTTSVTGTVGIESDQNTVKLDSTDATNLARVESDLGNLKFDSTGNLETSAQIASPSAVTEQCMDEGVVSDWSLNPGGHTLCTDDVYATSITGSGMDDALELTFYLNGKIVLDLQGTSLDGSDSYQLDLTHPLHFDKLTAGCANASSNCKFNLVVLGNSTGN